MSTLDLSENGPSITRSYKNLVSSPPPNNPSPTYASWALYSVSAPLQNAFVLAGPGKDSILKVQSTGEGELAELIEEFSEGKVQFAFVKVKDPNTGLGKFALIGWCGDGVPERVKGYFNGHLSSVSKILHGYHVQITARNDGDLNPESIIQKIENASGAKYSESTKPKPAPSSQPAPAVATKPLYLNKPSFPGRVTGGSFNSKPRSYGVQSSGKVDTDGWGEDAPPVTRNQLEKVGSAYKPTKVDINALRSQPSDTTSGGGRFERPEPVRGAYQPTGKVDIAEIRRQANVKEERPEPVKGAYQPIGKVDIAAIRAQAKPRAEEREEEAVVAPVAQRAAAFSQPAQSSERMTSLPKPKPAKKFGAGTPSYGTKPLTPGVFNAPPPVQVGSANKDFASQGGKTPAQIWAEKKARERGLSGASETTPPAFSPSYTGTSFQGVSASHTGRSAASNDGGVSGLASRFSQQKIDDTPSEPSPSISDLRNKFAKPISSPSYPERAASPPPPSPPVSSRPVAAPEPSYNRAASPEQPPRVDTPPGFEVKGSPIRIAMPVARTDDDDIPPIEPERAPSPVRAPVRQPSPEPAPVSHRAVPSSGVLVAIAQYDYEKAEENEIGFAEGETITEIDQVDDDWWEGTNAAGERGLFPANYVELSQGGAAAAPVSQPAYQEETPREPEPTPQAVPAAAAAPAAQPSSSGATATAEYDYEAAEDNELSFPEGAIIQDIEFPDEDWWSGSYQGRHGLFPANYVKLNE